MWVDTETDGAILQYIMSEDKDQIINDLKSELEKARLDHEAYDLNLSSYKEECKNLESLLEGEVKKKEGEIKRIK